jgi:hypothetical protein
MVVYMRRQKIEEFFLTHLYLQTRFIIIKVKDHISNNQLIFQFCEDRFVNLEVTSNEVSAGFFQAVYILVENDGVILNHLDE